MKVLINCLAIGTAGFFGALTRYGVWILFRRWLPNTSFPIGTFVINVTGSAFLGWFLTVIGTRAIGPHSETLRLAIATGFLGAYTTFSTYMYESNNLASDGALLEALSYLFGSLALGLIGVRLGIYLARL
ncbi:MAG TPA: fluoride efflux transporter CrcB [Humisphaera sp.]|jgi:CrcB protein|nr:fluoride efflux transporter CrcB [Humisphaera sp.]